MKYKLAIPLLLFLWSCSSTDDLAKDTDEKATSDSPQISMQDKINADRHFIRGIASFENGDYEEAIDYLTFAHSKLPDKSGIHFALADAYLNNGDINSAIYYGEFAVSNEPKNKWYRLKLAEAYRQSGRFAETIEQLHAILETTPTDVDVLYLIAGIESRRGRFEESNKAYERLLNLLGPDRSIYYQIFQNHTAQGDQDAALEQLEKIREIDPDNIGVLQTLSQFYLETNQIEKAMKMLEDALQFRQGDPELLISLADIYISQGQWVDAGEILQQIIQDPNVPVNNKAEILQYLISRQSSGTDNEVISKLTDEIIENLLEMHGEESYVHAVIGDYYFMFEDFDNAIYHLRRTTELRPENDAAWQQLLQALYSSGQYEEAVKTGIEADQVVPDDAFIQFFIGGSYMMLDQNEKSIEWLTRAADMPSRRGFRSIITSTLADAHASADNWEEADKAYEQALRLDSENDVALNNFAYYLSEREIQLERAKEMAIKALEINPNNAAYLDTMGWIYFKLGDYDQAKKYIKASIETGSASPTVLEHMGDVYEKLGDMDNAQRYWKKAFDEDETRTHLKEKLPGT